jgi:hypothetical protein
MNGATSPDPCAPIHVEATPRGDCARIRGTFQDACTAVTCPLQFHAAKAPPRSPAAGSVREDVAARTITTPPTTTTADAEITTRVREPAVRQRASRNGTIRRAHPKGAGQPRRPRITATHPRTQLLKEASESVESPDNLAVSAMPGHGRGCDKAITAARDVDHEEIASDAGRNRLDGGMVTVEASDLSCWVAEGDAATPSGRSISTCVFPKVPLVPPTSPFSIVVALPIPPPNPPPGPSDSQSSIPSSAFRR